MEPRERTTRCSECESFDVYFDPTYGFYECQACKNVWDYEKYDPDNDEEEIDLGSCCACGSIGSAVRTIDIKIYLINNA